MVESSYLSRTPDTEQARILRHGEEEAAPAATGQELSANLDRNGGQAAGLGREDECGPRHRHRAGNERQVDGEGVFS